MEIIVWNSSYSVGVRVLDDQHKQIIKTINQLNTEAADPETTSDVLTKLTQYASEHFKTEEQLFEQYGFPATIQHKEEHKAFRLKVADFCVKAIDNKELLKDMLRFTTEWWIDHILQSDMKYRPFFKEFEK